MKYLAAIFLSLTLAAAMALPARAEEPIDVLKTKINAFIDILQDPAYAGGKDSAGQSAKIKALFETTFNYTSVARGALGRNWRKFSEAEQQEFTRLFSELLVDSYLGKIQKSYRDETVVYGEQEMLKPTLAKIGTRVPRDAGDIPVDYVLSNAGGEWRVIDILVEGVSLIANYRSQYNDLLVNNPPSAAIESVKKQLAEVRAGN